MQVSIYSSEIVSIEAGGDEAKYIRLVHKEDTSIIFFNEKLAGELIKAVQRAFPKLAANGEDEALDKWAQEHEGEFVKPAPQPEVYVAEWVRKGQ